MQLLRFKFNATTAFFSLQTRFESRLRDVVKSMDQLLGAIFTGNLANHHRSPIEGGPKFNANSLFTHLRAAGFDDGAVGQRMNAALDRKPRDRFGNMESIEVIPLFKLKLKTSLSHIPDSRMNWVSPIERNRTNHDNSILQRLLKHNVEPLVITLLLDGHGSCLRDDSFFYRRSRFVN